MTTGAADSEWRSLREGRRDLLLARIRYGVAGGCTNAVGYLLYRGLSRLGLGPKSSMSLLYAIGATMGFSGNRHWVFAHEGHALDSMARYWIAHSIGYGINFALLYGLVDVLGYSHPIVQAAAILVVAGCLFLMFHFFVFPQGSPAEQQTRS